MAKLDLKTLNLPYGMHVIKAKAKGTGFLDSEFSNAVNYESKPICVHYDRSTMRIINCRSAATQYEIYNGDDNLLTTIAYSGADGGYVDVDITALGLTEGEHNPLYCKAVVGDNRYSSDEVLFWYGDSAVLGVKGLYASETACERTDDAVGLTWVMTENEISSDFDTYFPYNKMQKVTIGDNEFVYVPMCYWRLGYDDDGILTDIAVSPSEMEPLNDNQIITRSDAFYYGAYGASVESNVMKSKTGVARKYSTTRSGFRTLAQANGEGYHLIDALHTRILELLWLIEFAEKNSENIMWGATSYGAACGVTDVLTQPSGQIASQGRMRWRYIEDFVGNGFEWIDGITGAFITSDPNKYGDSNEGSQWASASIGGYFLTGLGSIDGENPLLLVPKTWNEGSASTYFCDYIYLSYSLTTAYVAYRGRADSSVNCGLFYWAVVYGTSYDYNDVGARLLYLP